MAQRGDHDVGPQRPAVGQPHTVPGTVGSAAGRFKAALSGDGQVCLYRFGTCRFGADRLDGDRLDSERRVPVDGDGAVSPPRARTARR